ncbi:MAG: glycosyltransferase, partial [Burkholderiales bacterium]|nr:glycosyltransferase [Phycisphaerae bacterium]
MIAFFSLHSTFYSPLFLAYLLVGPVAWVIIAYLMIVGRERMSKLRHSKSPLPVNPPLVSILIPAKDEAGHIRACIERVLQQDYPAFEVIAINDRSIDTTGSVLDDFVGRGSPHHLSQNAVDSDGGDEPHATKTLRVVHVTELPAGWLGKCHALDVGGKHAKGEWLFFVDSNVKLQPDALSKMAALAIERNYDAMSITTTIETEYVVEKMMLPLLAATWATMFAADQTNE